MDRRSNPTPEQMLTEVDRLIAARHRQTPELQRLRRLLMGQLYLFEKVGRRETDRPPPRANDRLVQTLERLRRED
jgi:hypothetical protein